MATLAPSFMIGSSSFFHETNTTIKSGQSSNFGQVGPRAAELTALERIKKIIMELLWENRFGHSSKIHFSLDLFHSCRLQAHA